MRANELFILSFLSFATTLTFFCRVILKFSFLGICRLVGTFFDGRARSMPVGPISSRDVEDKIVGDFNRFQLDTKRSQIFTCNPIVLALCLWVQFPQLFHRFLAKGADLIPI